MSNWPSHSRKDGVHGFRIEPVVEVTAGPADKVFILNVRRIEDDFQKFPVS